MRKGLALLVMLTLVLSLFVTPVLAAEPIDPSDSSLVMYASKIASVGDVVPVKMGPYNGWTHAQRLCPKNALGEFDAMPGADKFNERFFAVASREWVEYTFDGKFGNVDGAPDIEFCEVTWGSGNSWHVEAVKVYLTGATVRDGNGNVVSYGATDDEIGYYAGVAWNRTGIAYVPLDTRIEIAENYLPGVERDYDANKFYYNGTFGWTQFNLPEEVVCAEGIYLVDITAEVYAEGNAGGTFSNGPGALVTVLNCPVEGNDDVEVVWGHTGNTDGYDLDAIRVYRCPYIGGDTATGMGGKILPKGTWFMYNRYTGGDKVYYDIQAGNPKNGTNFIGTYWIEDLGDGNFVANYDIDETIEMNGYIYDIVVVDEHLGISNSMSFQAKPGQDDNADFGVPFYDEDGEFYIFAHFAVEYR